MKTLIFILVLSATPLTAFAEEFEIFVDSASLNSTREHLMVGIHYCGDAGEIPMAMVTASSLEDNHTGGGPASQIHFRVQATNKVLKNGSIIFPLEQCVRVITKEIPFDLKSLGLQTPSPTLYIYGNRGTRMSTVGAF